MLKILLLFIPLVMANNYKDLVQLHVKYFSHQGEDYLSLNYKNKKGWHTYWKNPGDAGTPLHNDFSVGKKKFSPKELEWPTPKRYLEEGDLLAYGYEGEYSLFYKLPKNYFSKKDPVTLKSRWLVCKKVCIPGSFNLQIPREKEFQGWNIQKMKLSPQTLAKRIEKLPTQQKTLKHLNLFLTRVKDKQKLVLNYELKNPPIKHFQREKNLLYPFPNKLLDYKREKLFQKSGSMFGRMNIDWDGEFEEPARPLPRNGIFSRAQNLKFLYLNPFNKKTEIINIAIKSFSVKSESQIDDYFKNLDPLYKVTPLKSTTPKVFF